MNLAGFNLIGSRLCRAELAHSNLAKATLEGADLNKCDLWDANLREARLTWVSCRAAELGRANLTDAWLLGAHLNGVDFYQTNLDGAFLIGADLTDVKTMAAVSARNANLWKATLVNAFIGDRDLFQKIRDEEKELSDGTLFDKQLLANLYVEREAAKVHLEGAFLCSADLSRAFFWNVDLDGADLANAKLIGTILDGVDLSKVEGLTPDQLTKAHVNQSTQFPDYFTVDQKTKLYSLSAGLAPLP